MQSGLFVIKEILPVIKDQCAFYCNLNKGLLKKGIEYKGSEVFCRIYNYCVGYVSGRFPECNYDKGKVIDFISNYVSEVTTNKDIFPEW